MAGGNSMSYKDEVRLIKALADEEIELAYPELARKYANGSGTEKDKEKAREYFMKTVDAGILSKHDAQQFLYFLNDNPDIFVSDEHRSDAYNIHQPPLLAEHPEKVE